uniref:Uncharacterized protein n=1 Tax=viral metagenome TaxID=1070528 RepID=A0A6C0KGY0_9ZZZZ
MDKELEKIDEENVDVDNDVDNPADESDEDHDNVNNDVDNDLDNPDDESGDEADDEEDKKEKRPRNSPTDFSKNGIINLSRKAGIKCISHCGIHKIKELLHEKIKVMSNNLASFYTGNAKTVTKQIMVEFLESEGVHFTHMVKNE